MKKEVKLFLAVAIFMLLVLNSFSFSVSALTAVNKNARMVLYPEVDGKTFTTIEKAITVENVNDEKIIVKLVATDDSKEFIEVIDDEFELEIGEEKKAKFLVKVKEPGTYDGRINVLFSPADLESKSPGVALATTVVVIAKNAEDIDVEDNEGTEVGVSGNVVGNKSENENGFNKGVGLLLGTSLVLIVALAGMFYYMNSKKRKVEKENSKIKKGGKINGKRSVKKEWKNYFWF